MTSSTKIILFYIQKTQIVNVNKQPTKNGTILPWWVWIKVRSGMIFVSWKKRTNVALASRVSQQIFVCRHLHKIHLFTNTTWAVVWIPVVLYFTNQCTEPLESHTYRSAPPNSLCLIVTLHNIEAVTAWDSEAQVP